MLKYVTTAMALKAFSATPLTKRLYRSLGNRVGNERRRTGPMPRYYVDRVQRMLNLLDQHQIVSDGDRILELGTGWLHWEALTLRLFLDVEAVLFDVWDNRQLGALKNYVHQLSPILPELKGISPERLRRAQALTADIERVHSFEELYRLMAFTYVVEPSGSLAQFSPGSFQLVVSAGVLEHVYEQIVPPVIASTHRILRPGGWAVHSIDTSDHLSHYDRSVSPKRYLGFSEPTWRWVCDNDVQHINRIQRGEWLDIFARAGFEVVDEDSRRVDISDLTPVGRFAAHSGDDLACTVIRLALRATASRGAA